MQTCECFLYSSVTCVIYYSLHYISGTCLYNAMSPIHFQYRSESKAVTYRQARLKLKAVMKTSKRFRKRLVPVKIRAHALVKCVILKLHRAVPVYWESSWSCCVPAATTILETWISVLSLLLQYFSFLNYCSKHKVAPTRLTSSSRIHIYRDLPFQSKCLTRNWLRSDWLSQYNTTRE
jgi:hypothetical protein